MSDFRQAAIDAILEDLDFDSVKELRAYVSKNKQDDYFYGGILHAINAVQDLPPAQPVARDTNVLSNDTISRQGVKEWLNKWEGYIDRDIIARMQCRVIDIPSAQPEIIRCKECKHAKITADGKYMKYCSQWDVDDALYLDGDFFCGHAERRTNG